MGKTDGMILLPIISFAYFPMCQQILNPFQPSFVFHIETSHFICSEKQMTGFCMKHNTVLIWVKVTLPDPCNHIWYCLFNPLQYQICPICHDV